MPIPTFAYDELAGAVTTLSGGGIIWRGELDALEPAPGDIMSTTKQARQIENEMQLFLLQNSL
jgi:hypothetical protein